MNNDSPNIVIIKKPVRISGEMIPEDKRYEREVYSRKILDFTKGKRKLKRRKGVNH